MGHQYTPSSTAWNTDYTIPDDGDDIDAASVNVAEEAVGNRTECLRRQVYGIPLASDAGGGYDWVPVALTPVANEGDNWSFRIPPRTGTGVGAAGWVQLSAADHYALVFPLDDLPKAGKLVQLIAQVVAGTGHSTLPGATHRPELQLWVQDPGDATATVTLVQSQTDASASVAAYEANHTITMTGITTVTWENAAQSRYYAVLYGEDNGGGDGLIGYTIVNLTAVIQYS